jgi:hypothetical protein
MEARCGGGGGGGGSAGEGGEDWITVNVGGTKFGTTRSTLRPSPYFSLLLDSGAEGAIFVDRDPLPFPAILSYLREGLGDMDWDFDNEFLATRVVVEASFYGLFLLAEVVGKNLVLKAGDIVLGTQPFFPCVGFPTKEIEVMASERGLADRRSNASAILVAIDAFKKPHQFGDDLFRLPLPREVLPGVSFVSQARARLNDRFRNAATFMRTPPVSFAAILFMLKRAAFSPEWLLCAMTHCLRLTEAWSGGRLAAFNELLVRGVDVNGVFNGEATHGWSSVCPGGSFLELATRLGGDYSEYGLTVACEAPPNVRLYVVKALLERGARAKFSVRPKYTQHNPEAVALLRAADCLLP